jgi:cholesterol transport system auxiliary component
MPVMYELVPPTEFPADLPRVPWSLVVGRPSVVGALDSANIAVRPEPFCIEYYADGRWTTAAPDMLHNHIVRSFQNTGLIATVGRSASALDANHLLETDLVSFETIYPPGSGMPEVHVRIHANLLAIPGGSTLASRGFAAAARPQSPTLPHVIEAFDQATAEVVQNLIRWTLTTPRRGGA